MKYHIICHQNAPLSSWDEPYTRKEIIEKFYGYALNEWDNVTKKSFTLGFISEMWDVDFRKDC